MTREEFVKTYYPAVAALVSGTGILPETVLTVAILESSDSSGNVGGSTLASKYNNYFGIKAGSSWTGPVVDMPTYEYINGQKTLVHDYFRVYPSFIASAGDFVKLLTTASRYKPVLQADTAQAQFQALQQAGYSTNPSYASILSKVWQSVSGFVSNNPLASSGLAVVGLAALLAFLLANR